MKLTEDAALEALAPTEDALEEADEATEAALEEASEATDDALLAPDEALPLAPAPAPTTLKRVVEPTVVLNVEEPEVSTETMAEVVIADEDSEAPEAPEDPDPAPPAYFNQLLFNIKD